MHNYLHFKSMFLFQWPADSKGSIKEYVDYFILGALTALEITHQSYGEFSICETLSPLFSFSFRFQPARP